VLKVALWAVTAYIQCNACRAAADSTLISTCQAARYDLWPWARIVFRVTTAPQKLVGFLGGVIFGARSSIFHGRTHTSISRGAWRPNITRGHQNRHEMNSKLSLLDPAYSGATTCTWT